MRAFEALIFDLGNTLIYFDGAWPDVIMEADDALFQSLSAAGFSLERKPFLKRFREALDAYYQERDAEFVEYTTMWVLANTLEQFGYSGMPEDQLRPALAAMYAVSQAHWLPEEDALDTLAWLKAQGYRLGLISNAGDDQDVQTLIDKATLRPYFDQIISSAHRGIRKPNPRIFLELLDGWGLQPKQAAMVGDTLGADILGAHNAGMYAIWITRRANTPANQAHAETIQADATIERLSDLPQLLQQLAANPDRLHRPAD